MAGAVGGFVEAGNGAAPLEWLAGAIVEMMGGTPRQMDVIAFSMKTYEAAACDPVAGLVEYRALNVMVSM